MPKTCIIIPCYNEAERLPVQSFIDYANKHEDVSFHFVNDGSIDKTSEILKEICNGNKSFFYSNLKKNSGKAEAVRLGMQHALQQNAFDYMGYFDADLSAPLQTIDELLQIFSLSPLCKMTIGSRIKRMGSNIIRNDKRHYAGRVFATLSGWIIKLPVYDTQCGAKLFTAELSSQLFDKPFITKWLFDVELFARILKIYGYDASLKIIYELPLTEWIEKGNSKLKLFDFIRTPVDLWRIKNHYS